jgi:hypothetical protein
MTERWCKAIGHMAVIPATSGKTREQFPITALSNSAQKSGFSAASARQRAASGCVAGGDRTAL